MLKEMHPAPYIHRGFQISANVHSVIHKYTDNTSDVISPKKTSPGEKEMHQTVV
jgi:hypothetical protein